MLKNKWLMLMILSFGSFYLKPASQRWEQQWFETVSRENINSIEELIKKGINPIYFDKILHEAVKSGNYKLVQILLNNFVNPNATDYNLSTALHMAKDFKMIQILLNYIGTDPTKRDLYDKTPLVYQMRSKDLSELERSFILDEYLRKLEFDYEYFTEWQREDILKQYLWYKYPKRDFQFQINNLLHEAAKKGYNRIIKILLKQGANPNFKNEKGQTVYDVTPFWETKNIILMNS